MPRDYIPLFLREAVLTLYPTDAQGNALVTAPVWAGTCANSLKLGLAFVETLSFSSGDRYQTAHHEDEQHVIEVERVWVLRRSSPGELPAPRRGETYVLEIVWNDRRERVWYKRLYYGVTGRSADLTSDGPRRHDHPQVYRAQRFTASGGESTPSVFTPVETLGDEQVVAFFAEDPALTDAYLLGHYRWAVEKRITAARWAGWAPQAETVLGLEVNGVLTGDEITIPAGTANTEASGQVTLDVAVSAGMEVRWQVVSAPGIEEAAWHLAVVMTLRDVE